MSEAPITLLRQALTLHQQGKPDAAEAACRKVLVTDRRNVDALHLLGIIALQRGKPADAARRIGEAVAIAPQHPMLHSNLGIAQRAAGQPNEALRSYDRAIALRPDYAEVYNNRGIVLEQLGMHQEALESYDKAIQLRPDYAEAYFNRGNVLRAANRAGQALASYDQSIALRPNYPEAFNNRGDLLLNLHRREEALASFDEAVRLRPDYAQAIYNRANALHDLNRAEEALAAYERVIALDPNHPGALNNSGIALMGLNRHEAAVACYDRAVALRRDWPEALNNRGVALLAIGRLEAALASFDQALALNKDYADAHMNRSMWSLAAGDFDTGWREFEWRWQAPRLRRGQRRLAQPLWLGQADLAGRTLLLHAEQGLGDTLQFCRYATLAADRGARVVMEVQAPLRQLLTSLEGVSAVFSRGDALPDYDLHCPLLSLPHAFGTTLATIPASIPYLRADPAMAAAWRQRLAALPGLRVGIVWAGSRRPDDPLMHATDLRRSVTLARFAPLGSLPGISLVSLQKGEPAVEARAVPPGMVLHDWTDELEDFADTAAMVAGLDLVITVDTAVAHVAGALGKKVWIINRFDSCWRWLLEREDTPWYPTARLFRQPVPGDWDSVMTGLRDALQQGLAPALAD